MSAPPAVVVVGAGVGGVRCVEAMRGAGHTGPVTLVGAEPAWPYDRPPLSKAVLQHGTPAPLLRSAGDWAGLEVDLRLSSTAVGLDVAQRQVRLADGAVLAYDALVLAPGASPRRLPGPAPAGVHVLRTEQDAMALRRDVVEHGALTVVGAGFLGCEVAASARRLGAEVDLVEQLGGPLVRVLGSAVAGRIAQLHLNQGVRLHGHTAVAGLHGDGVVEAVELQDGRVLPARAVLVALGVVPATRWLAGTLALTPDGGIRCDPTGLAGEGVWAVGDAAAWGAAGRVEHWSSAVEQAHAVARSVLGTPTPVTAVPYVWSDQYDATLQCLGQVAPGTETQVLRVGTGLAALHTDGERLLGAALVDLRRQAGRVRRVLLAGGDVEQARAAVLR